MALIAAFIAAEKLLPWPAVARRTVAVLLLALGFGLGLGVAFIPADLPGFTEPDGGMNEGGGRHGADTQGMR